MNGVLFPFPLLLHRRKLLFEQSKFFAQRSEPRFGKVILFFGKRLFFHFKLNDFAVERIHFRRHGIDFRPNHSRRFVHKINRLVGKETVAYVPIGKGCRRDDGVVVNAHAVENFKSLFESAQDGDRIFYRRFSDKHRLKPTFKRRVFFNILAVFVQRRCADAVKFPARQKRF